jgi:hypothetical protein
MLRALASSLLAALLGQAAPTPTAGATAPTGEPPPITLVACAPGHPGTTAEAQPSMDAFAAALARAAGWPPARITATYLPSDREGKARLATQNAVVALIPLPFLLQHRITLGLTPRLTVEQKGLGPTETWTLVAKKGRVRGPADLAGFTVVSIAGYAPGFVRGVLGPAWRLPDTTKVVESGQVLSALRRAVKGDDVALLLDGAQGAALAGLPFAADLDLLARSAPLPAAVVATAGWRLGAARWTELEKGLLALPGDPAGAAALDAIRMVKFTPVDAPAIEAVSRLAGSDR